MTRATNADVRRWVLGGQVFSLLLVAFLAPFSVPVVAGATSISSTCVANPSTFALRAVEELKKLSREEFTSLPISPSGSPLLTRGTELNVVVDTQCLLDPARGPVRLTWLIQLKERLAPRELGGTLRSFRWSLAEDWDFYQLQDAFELEPCVNIVSPEGRYFPNGLNDPRMGEQTHLAPLKFHEVFPEFFMTLLSGHKVTIAVVDTGVDFSHPELRFNRWTNPGEISGNGRDDDRNGYVDDVHGYNFMSDSGDVGPQGDWPDNKHGTHVAGLAASRIDNATGGVGINGVARIMALNVFGASNVTRSSVLENALRYAADHRADIINLSLGGREYSRSMRSALQYAISRGSFIVAAAGNEGIELCNVPGRFEFVSPAVYGSSIDGMVTIASVDVLSGRLSRFSNFGAAFAEIAAPGAFFSDGALIGLLSTVPRDGYERLAGTSMASPIVSGAAALAVSWLKTYRYDVTPTRLERILKSSTREDVGLTGQVQSARTLDLTEMLAHLKRIYPARRTNLL